MIREGVSAPSSPLGWGGLKPGSSVGALNLDLQGGGNLDPSGYGKKNTDLSGSLPAFCC